MVKKTELEIIDREHPISDLFARSVRGTQLLRHIRSPAVAISRTYFQDSAAWDLSLPDTGSGS